MQPPAFPDNELQRLAALHERKLLDTLPEERFDRLTRLTKQMFGTQMALVSLVDSERQWFKSRQGLDACETGRDISFCGHAILGSDIFHIPDACLDPRFADNPLVVGLPHIRFYAGAPLSTADGYRIGTLCIIDDQPRKLTATELRALRDLADCVEAEINQLSMEQQKLELDQFKNTLDRTLDCVFMFDAKTMRFFYANQGALLQVGYSREELMDMHPYDIKPDITEAQFHELIAPLLAGEQASITFETVLQHKNGRRIPVEIFLQYMNLAGQAPRFVAIVRDITDRVRIEAERLRTASLLENVLMAASEFSIIATDPAGLITIFNAGAERLLGYSAEEMVGLQTPAIIHLPAEVMTRGKELSDEFGRPIEGFRVFIEKPEREGSEMREWTYVHKDGRHIPVSLVATAMREADGAIIGYLGIAEDITQRKLAEEKLRNTSSLLESILENVPSMIFLKRASDLRFEYFNRAGEQLLGYARADLLGRNDHDFFPKEQADLFAAKDRAVLEQEGVVDIPEESVDTAQGVRILHTQKLALRDVEGRPQYLLGISEDITERKRLERMKSEFVSTVSHELRTPLTSIAGALGLVSAGVLGALPERAQQMVEIAHKNSQRLTFLINDLLDMEKLMAGKMRFDLQQMELMPVVEQSIRDNQIYAEQRGVRLELIARADDAVVEVDPQRLQQVMANFLSNAAKFSPESGIVRVSVTRRDGIVRVEVKDNGPGIPPEFRDKIFQKFSQADSSNSRQNGGTGLGLAITKELVERMGGHVGFDSVEGQGACFFIELAQSDQV